MYRLLACGAVLSALAACVPSESEAPPEKPPPPVVALEKCSVDARPTVRRADGQEKVTVVVTVRASDDAPIADQPVTLLVSGEGHFVDPASARTNASGEATFTLTSTVAEQKRLIASVGGQQVPGYFEVEFVAGPPQRVRFRVPPSTVRAGQPISPAVIADLQDAYGNRVRTSGVEVNLELGSNPGNASLGGTLSAETTNGRVTFEDLTLDKAGAGYTLVASGPRLAPSASPEFEVTAGAPDRLGFVAAPTDASAGEVLGPVEVALVDPLGNRSTEGTASITLAIASGPPGATMKGQATVASVAGLARFTDLRFDQPGTYTLAATATGYAGATSDSFTIRAGAPKGLRFTSQPSGLMVRSPFSVAVAVEDAGGNVVTDSTATVTLTLSGVGPLNGTTSVAAIGGVATFGGLSLDNDGTAFQLEASSPGLSIALTQPFAVTDNLPPSPISDLRVTGEFGTSLSLAWTSVGDDGMLGQAARYEVRYGTSPITAANFASAAIAGLGTPRAPQQAESFIVENLTQNTLYYVALRIEDGAGNSVLATTSGRTTLCPRGYAGPQCDVCATGFRETSPGVCEDFCTNPDPCNPPPSPSCGPDGISVLTYPASRLCTPTASAPFYSCQAPNVTDCSATNRVCHQAQCVANPCQNITCQSQPPTCAADGLSLVTIPGVCARVEVGGSLQAQCSQGSPVVVNCGATGQVCLAGACQQASPPAPGELVISEVMYLPSRSPAGEWFEVVNLSGKLLDLAGVKVEIVGGQSFTVSAFPPVLVPAGDSFVFGYSADQGTNGGVPVDFAWGAVNPSLRLGANTRLRLTRSSTVLDALDLSNTPTVPVGTAVSLSSAALAGGANQRSWYWCAATVALPGGDRGTPGAPNGTCGIAPVAPIDWCVLQHPVDAGSLEATAPLTVFGRFFEPSVTSRNPAGNDFYPHVVAQVGIGPKPAAGLPDPSSWTWIAAGFNAGYVDSDPATDNDEVTATITPPGSGDFLFGFRFALRDPSTGALSPFAYCDRNGVVGTPAAGSYGTVNFTASSTGIDVARAAPDAVGYSIRVTNALVTYLKPAVGNDSAGFFVQAGPTGPALFVAVDPGFLSPPPAAGDRVDFTINAMGSRDGSRQAESISAYFRSSTGNPLAAVTQDVSTAIDLVTGLDGYESELLRLTGTFGSAFSSAGTGFVSAPLETAGVTGEPNLRMRMPITVRDQFDLGPGCQVTLNGGPMWRYFVQAQPSAWRATDFTSVDCPAPKVLSATPNSQTEVTVVFDRQIAPATVLANGSQFTFSPSLQVLSAVVSGPYKVTLTTGPQLSGTNYTVTVANSVKDLLGRGPISPNNRASFTGVVNVCTPSRVVISQVYGGGGNSGALYRHDFVELHNRSTQTLSLGGWSIQYASALGSGWTVAALPDAAIIAPGGFYLVQLDGNTSGVGVPLPTPDHATDSINMAGGSGKVALVDSRLPLTGTCPAAVDFVGYGSVNCYEGSSGAPLLGSATAATRSLGGCQDSSDNGLDFVASAPSPRTSASGSVFCGCD